MSEADIEDEVVAYAVSSGCFALKLRVDGQNGFPDRTILFGGRAMFIEFKTPEGSLRPMQKVWLSRLGYAGFEAAVVSSAEEGKRAIDKFLTGQK